MRRPDASNSPFKLQKMGYSTRNFAFLRRGLHVHGLHKLKRYGHERACLGTFGSRQLVVAFRHGHAVFLDERQLPSFAA